MFIPALLIIAPTWKISKCLSAIDQTNKWCFHTMEYSEMGMNIQMATCINMMTLRNVTVSERRHQNTKYVSPFISNPKTSKTHLLESGLWLPFEGGRVNRTQQEGCFWDAEMFYFLIWVLAKGCVHFSENSSSLHLRLHFSCVYAIC